MSKRAKELLEIFKDNEVTTSGCVTRVDEQDLVYRLNKRAEIRRQIKERKSVKEGKPDRISDLLEEAAKEIQRLRSAVKSMDQMSTSYDLDGPMIKMFRD